MFTKLCFEKSQVGGTLGNVGYTPNTPQEYTGWTSAFKAIGNLEDLLPGLRKSWVEVRQTYLLSIKGHYGFGGRHTYSDWGSITHLFSWQYSSKRDNLHFHGTSSREDIFRSGVGRTRVIEKATGERENPMANSG